MMDFLKNDPTLAATFFGMVIILVGWAVALFIMTLIRAFCDKVDME